MEYEIVKATDERVERLQAQSVGFGSTLPANEIGGLRIAGVIELLFVPMKKKSVLIKSRRTTILHVGLFFLIALFSTTLLVNKVYAQNNNHNHNTDPVITLADFERLYIGGENTPTNSDALPKEQANAPWESVTLKDFWFLQKRRDHQQAWYRTSFTVDSLNEGAWAIYVARISAVAEFWINDIKIGNSVELTDPLPNAWNHPTLVKFSSDVLKPGENTLYIRLTIEPTRTGALFEMQLGPQSTLQPIYDLSYFLKVTASQTLTVVMLIITAMMAFLCFTSQQPKSYFWFMCGSLAWAAYSIHLHWVSIPVPIRWWHSFYISCQICSGVFYVLAVHRMLGIQRRWLEYMLAVIIIIVSASTLRVPDLYIPLCTTLSLYVNFAVAFYLGVVMFVRGLSSHEENRTWLIAAGTIILVMVCYDQYMIFFQVTANFAKYPFIPGVAMICGSGLFLKRFISTDIENTYLKQENESDKQEVARSAVSEERERLMREIHDGVGGQLMSTLSMMEKQPRDNQQVVEALRTSLSDLRLIINSLETMGQKGSVVTLLATMREKIEPQLIGQGIRLEWGVRSLPDIEHFDSEHSLHLMRIIQEAVANVIKHANATYIRIACGETQNQGSNGIFVEISNDNVIGTDSKTANLGLDSGISGYGLENMKYRAEEIGGQFSFSQAEEEAKVYLWIPLSVATLK